MKKFCFALILCFSISVFGLSSIEKAVLDAGIAKSDSLEVKIDKALKLLNEERYFYPEKPIEALPTPFDIPYHLDSMRTPEEILSQKVGGSCGSSALAFAAILKSSGVDNKDIQIVNAVVNKDLSIICPSASKPRVQNPRSGAPGHVFVAIRFTGDRWKIINSIGGSKHYERADWFSPEEIQQKIKSSALAVPVEAFKSLPEKIYSSGLTVFQSWAPDEVLIHTFEQRYDVIASGKLNELPVICRFTAPK